jgi:GntR family transcriptional regulator
MATGCDSYGEHLRAGPLRVLWTGVDRFIVLVYYITIVLAHWTNAVHFLIDTKSGVPFYRQIIEQAKFAIARGDLQPGDRLPTVRQLAVDLSINPNTVVRAYRELEIEGMLETQQGSGTFVNDRRPEIDGLERQRMLDQILTDMLARASSYGFTLDEVLGGLQQRKEEKT